MKLKGPTAVTTEDYFPVKLKGPTFWTLQVRSVRGSGSAPRWETLRQESQSDQHRSHEDLPV